MNKLPFKETISMHLFSLIAFGLLFLLLYYTPNNGYMYILAILGYIGSLIMILSNTQFHSNKPIMWINKE